MTNASSKGWRFSDGVEFTATVEDESFLNEGRERKVKFENGTAIRAIMRTVQRKNIRTITDRTIVEVKEVFPPEENVFKRLGTSLSSSSTVKASPKRIHISKRCMRFFAPASP